ncbi:FAD-binding protein, partial [Streptomyces sp. SID10244]|nr:FAD-binding protein [Streptomyces sp. SID10244]
MAGAIDPAEQNTTAPKAEGETYDVVVVGAGAAGLSAAITAAASGLKTVIIE